MKIEVLTLFPELFEPFLEWSMVKKAREIKAATIKIHNLRKWAIDERGTVDDHPYGGGPGMILRVEPIFNALRALKLKSQNLNLKTKSKISNLKSKIILLSPQGKMFDQKMARQLAKLDRVILICGHYEGVDERVRKHLVDQEISIGNYVLSGGELPAMVVIDSIARLLPKVLEKEGASEVESFSPGLEKLLSENNHQSKMINEKLLLEFPQYTRPTIFKGWRVPKVLLSGNHQEIRRWRAGKTKIKNDQ